MEQLIYDCRLLNQAQREGKDAADLQKWLESDSPRSPAYVLRPDVVYTISENRSRARTFKRTKLAAQRPSTC